MATDTGYWKIKVILLIYWKKKLSLIWIFNLFTWTLSIVSLSFSFFSHWSSSFVKQLWIIPDSSKEQSAECNMTRITWKEEKMWYRNKERKERDQSSVTPQWTIWQRSATLYPSSDPNKHTPQTQSCSNIIYFY
jgi:hypothetical protein